ncbi:hypothetical protein [Streptomyces sp. S.PNR 29]|uniref:hypothetical protein n=1 Tax=Streptomyces sp. S.PNR 29 TaxID=2973805 RepID=UPI0025B20263|nr:hypothetical protein [Streptomyces sp. S.PNR 29]MDN0194677.1 hypothetical protein [Streptomyces sp. S.PNR 29]
MTSPQMRQEPIQDETPRTAPSAEEARGREEARGGKVVHLHTAHPRVPIPYVTPGDMFRSTQGATGAVMGLLPSPRKLAFYGILGGMAAAGALAWPVAVTVGAATEVITREQAARERGEREREQSRQSAEEPSIRPDPAVPGQTVTG